MDKIQKALSKLSSKEYSLVKKILERIKRGDLRGLDVKKLRDRNDVFRVRKASTRIVYRVVKGRAEVLIVERRGDTTYKKK